MPTEKNDYSMVFDVDDDYKETVDKQGDSPDDKKANLEDTNPDYAHLLKQSEGEGEESEGEDEGVGEDEDEGTEVELSPAEQKAVDNGWLPKDEWVEAGNDESDWVDANTFNMRGDLLGKVYKERRYTQQLRGEIQELRTALQQLGEHNAKLARQEVDSAMRQLRAQKSQAEHDEDFDAVAEYDEKLEELREAKQSLSEQNQDKQDDAPQVNPAVKAWVERGQSVMAEWEQENSWYGKDRVMQAAAKSIADEIYNANVEADGTPGITPEALLSQVKARMKKEFPHKFQSQKRTPKVTGRQSGDGRAKARTDGKKWSGRDMSSEQRRIYRSLKSAGLDISESDYASQLAKLGELPSQQK